MTNQNKSAPAENSKQLAAVLVVVIAIAVAIGIGLQVKGNFIATAILGDKGSPAPRMSLRNAINDEQKCTCPQLLSMKTPDAIEKCLKSLTKGVTKEGIPFLDKCILREALGGNKQPTWVYQLKDNPYMSRGIEKNYTNWVKIITDTVSSCCNKMDNVDDKGKHQCNFPLFKYSAENNLNSDYSSNDPIEISPDSDGLNLSYGYCSVECQKDPVSCSIIGLNKKVIFTGLKTKRNLKDALIDAYRKGLCCPMGETISSQKEQYKIDKNNRNFMPTK